MKKLFLGFLFLFSAILLNAVPAYPGLLTKVQPDGSVLSYYLRGAETFGFSTTEDGFLIALNENGVFEYAELSDNLEIIPIGIKVSNVSERTVKENKYLKRALKVSDLQAQLTNISVQARQNAQQRVVEETKSPVMRYPLKGEPTSLVILVNFQDVKFTSETPKEDFSAFLKARQSERTEILSNIFDLSR